MTRSTKKEQMQDVLEARAGNADAYTRLYQLAQPLLRRSLYRFVDEADLDDVVQNTMVKAFTRLDQFAGDAAFTTWVVSIGRNEALGLYRKNGSYRRCVTPIDAPVRLADGSEVPLKLPGYEDRTFERKMAHETVHRALQALKDEEHLAMLMKLDGHSNEEIADRLEKTIGATKSILYRAKAAMSERILAQAA